VNLDQDGKYDIKYSSGNSESVPGAFIAHLGECLGRMPPSRQSLRIKRRCGKIEHDMNSPPVAAYAL